MKKKTCLSVGEHWIHTRAMNLELRRVILFAQDMNRLAAFYRDVLGLEELTTPDDSRTWREFAAGACNIALHNGGQPRGGQPGSDGRPPKLTFYVADVAKARTELNARGANFGRVIKTGEFTLCNGTDPEGNALALSSRD
jgi:predicted enzyme related to lactoylglutathione lyase